MNSRALRLLRGFVHSPAETERSHIGPHLLDISEAFLFRTRLAGVVPAEGIFTIGRPDRILLLVVHDNFVNSVIFSFICAHRISPIMTAKRTTLPFIAQSSSVCFRALTRGRAFNLAV